MSSVSPDSISPPARPPVPTDINAQILITNHPRYLHDAVRILNSLSLDEQMQHFSIPFKEYFNKHNKCDQYSQYLRIIHPNQPMDFRTIKTKLINKKYTSSAMIYADMELVFKNAKIFNKKGNSWYNQADRLCKIYKSLKNKKTLTVLFKPKKDLINYLFMCPHCDSILMKGLQLMDNKSKYYKCGICVTLIAQSNIFCCYNHADGNHYFCKKHIIPYCNQCKQWHAIEHCPKAISLKKQKPKNKKRKRIYSDDDDDVSPAKRQKISKDGCTQAVNKENQINRKTVLKFIQKQQFYIERLHENENKINSLILTREQNCFKESQTETEYIDNIAKFVVDQTLKLFKDRNEEHKYRVCSNVVTTTKITRNYLVQFLRKNNSKLKDRKNRNKLSSIPKKVKNNI